MTRRTNILIVSILALALLAALAYLATQGTDEPAAQPVATSMPVTASVPAATPTIVWNFKEAGERGNVLYTTTVTVNVDGTPYEVGTYEGKCTEIGVSGGMDGTGLVPGEITGVQCWFGGGGDEIGIFNEGGRLIIKSAELYEGLGGVRGEFTTLRQL